jgi:hypothetical protein
MTWCYFTVVITFDTYWYSLSAGDNYPKEINRETKKSEEMKKKKKSEKKRTEKKDENRRKWEEIVLWLWLDLDPRPLYQVLWINSRNIVYRIVIRVSFYIMLSDFSITYI